MSEEYYDYEPTPQEQRTADLNIQVANYQLQLQQLDNINRFNQAALMVCQQKNDQLSREVMNLANEMENRDRNTAQIVNQINNEISSNLRRANERMEKLTSDLTERMKQNQDDMKDYVDSTSRKINEIIRQNRREVELAIQTSQEKVERDLANIRNDVNKRFAEIQQEIDDMSRRVSELERDKFKRDEWRRRIVYVAEGYYEQANILRNYIKDRNKFPHAALLFEKEISDLNIMFEDYKKYRNDIRLDENEIDRSFRENSIRLLNAALSLYCAVCEAEQKWQEEKMKLIGMINVVTGHAKASKLIQPDNQNNDKIDVDFWTVGELTSIYKLLGEIYNELHNENNINFESFKLFEDAILQLDQEIDSAVKNATLAFYASQRRKELADDVEKEFNKQGYVKISETVDDEGRGLIQMTLQNEIGENATLVAQPKTRVENVNVLKNHSKIKKFEIENAGKETFEVTTDNRDGEYCKNVQKILKKLAIQQRERSIERTAKKNK